MRKSYVLFTACFFFTVLLANYVSGEKMRDINSLDLSIKTRDIQTANMSGLKPDINFGKFPLYFITNKGQVNKKVKFYAKASRYTLWLTKEGLVFGSTHPAPSGHRSREKHTPPFGHPSQEGNSKEYSPTHKLSNSLTHKLSNSTTPQLPNSSTRCARDVSRLMFIGANKNPGIVPIEKAKIKVNYFIGNDKSKWHCDVPTSQAVLYKDLYKNIDLKVYGIEKQIEYDWIVKPGGNPADIKFLYKNVKGTHIDAEGNLLIKTGFGELMHKKPVSYQEGKAEGTKAKRHEVDVSFKKTGKNTYGFSVGKYDKCRELIIDPIVLVYSTYLGGSLHDWGSDIAVDSSGYVYVTGDTYSTNFPTLDQYQENQGSSDVFVTKIDTTQSGAAGLIYSTYLGGSGYDWSYGIAVDNSGYVYVTGWTANTDFPTLNPYQGTFQGGDSDAFVTKIDTTQSGAASLIYSTYLGGAGNEHSSGIAVDRSGYVYVIGRTYSTNFPILDQYQTNQGGWGDAFVTKIDTTQSGAASLIYSTYLGGASYDCGNGIAVGNSGYVYVTGQTSSTDFPTLDHYQGTHQGGNRDAFVTKIDTTQSGAAGLIYSTYLGGEDDDTGLGIAVDSSGYVYVTGRTESTDFPTLDHYQGTHQGGDRDAFVTKIDTTQSGAAGLIYSTYLGGSDSDSGLGIAVDSSGDVYLTGYTYSTDFPTINQYQGTHQGGWDDAFVTKIDTTQSGAAGLIYSTYLGGEDDDIGIGIAVDSIGYVYVTGVTYSNNFPTLNQYQLDQGYHDAFVTKLNYITPPTVTTAAVTSIGATYATGGGEVTSDGGAAVTYRGVCWNKTGDPTTADINTVDGSGIGPFTSYITGLTPNTTYYVCAYAKNSIGTGYGETLKFKTLNNPSISGTIKSSSGTGIEKVTLTFSNSGGTTTTNQAGYYSHSVVKNWSGTVTPSKTGFVFKPAKRTYNTVTSDRVGQDYTAYYITLSLNASMETESAWIIRRQYGKIELKVNNPGGITVSKYVIYRKETGGNYAAITEIPASQFQGSTYLYYDKFLDKDKSYTYKFTAVDARGVTFATSNEKTISSQISASFTINRDDGKTRRNHM